MPRTYKSSSTKPYKKYDESAIEAALQDYRINGSPIGKIATKYGISKSVLYRHNTKIMKKHGGQTVLSSEVENHIVENLNQCTDWGRPLNTSDLRLLIKGCLDAVGVNVKRFRDNLPGPDFIKAFLQRHQSKISVAISKKLKRCREAVSTEKSEEKSEDTILAGLPKTRVRPFDNENVVQIFPGHENRNEEEEQEAEINESVLSILKEMRYDAATNTTTLKINKNDLKPVQIVFSDAYAVSDTEVTSHCDLDEDPSEGNTEFLNLPHKQSKPKLSKKPYKKYDETAIEAALQDYRISGSSLREIATKYRISKSVLYRHNTRIMKKHGGQMVLSSEVENHIVENLNRCTEWDRPLNTSDLRLLIKGCLDAVGVNVKRFRDNLPGPDFIKSFLQRHKSKISVAISKKLKRCRAALSTEKLKEKSEDTIRAGLPKTRVRPLDNENVVQIFPGHENRNEIEDQETEMNESVLSILKEMRSNAATNTTTLKINKNDLKPVQIVFSDAYAVSDTEVTSHCDLDEDPSEGNTEFLNLPHKQSKPKSSKKPYKKYDESAIEAALQDYRISESSLKEIATKYGISKSVLYRHNTRIMKKHGGQMVLSSEVENHIVENLNRCTEWDRPLNTSDLRLLIKGCLDAVGVNVKRFRDNLPGPDFIKSFLQRHQSEISVAISKKFKRFRAERLEQLEEKRFSKTREQDFQISETEVTSHCDLVEETSEDNAELQRSYNNEIENNDINEFITFRKPAETNSATKNMTVSIMASSAKKPVRLVNVVPLKSNRKVVPVTDDDDQVVCGYCGKGFASDVALTNHTRMEHVEVPDVVDLKRSTVCPIQQSGTTECGKSDSPIKKHKPQTKQYPKFKRKNQNKIQQAPEVTKVKTEELLSSMTPGNITSLASEDVSYIIIKSDENVMEESKKPPKVKQPRKKIVKLKEPIPVPGPFECVEPSNKSEDGICHQIFNSCCEYSSHFRDKHPRRRKVALRCQVCEKSLVPQDEAKAPYACEVCGAGFNSKKKLIKHVSKVHAKLRPFECDICHKRFTQMGGLQQHMRMHTGDRPYSCTFCDKSFTQIAGLDQHLRIHTKEKPYRCIICGNSFAQTGHLRQHMRTHTNVAPFQCEICQEKFKQHSHLSFHIKHHNPANMTDDQKRKYENLMGPINKEVIEIEVPTEELTEMQVMETTESEKIEAETEESVQVVLNDTVNEFLVSNDGGRTWIVESVDS